MTHTPTTPQHHARTVTCPTCLSRPGQNCTTDVGNPIKPGRPHRARIRAAHRKDAP